MEVISLERLKIPKMKKTFIALTFCLLLTSPIFSQKSKPDELQSLYKQIPVLLEQDKLDEENKHSLTFLNIPAGFFTFM
ncbi:MAG TPA: hypothetical protein VGC97_21115 [Pyrinomonadaceae bacterium]|jgi:hypothetical protein